jgi:hypothetical protein
VILLALSAPAPPLPAVPAAPAAVRPAELAGDWPVTASGKTVTVEAKTANQALREIAGAAGWGLALNAGPAGDSAIEFSFKTVPVEEAFAAVLYAAKLHAVRIGDTVAVTPRESLADDDAPTGPGGAEPDQGPAAPFLRMARKHHRGHHGGNDRIQVGHDIDIAAGEKVGDVIAVGGSVHIGKGATVDDVVAIGGRIETDADVQINGDATAIGGEEHLGTGTQVAGNSVTLGGALELDPGAAVKGQHVNLQDTLGFHHPDWHLFGAGGSGGGGLLVLFWVRKLAEFVLYFCLGALLLFAAPTHLATMEAFLVRQPIRAGLAGFLATLAIPILAVLLLVTIVGLALIPVEIFAVALAVVMGFTALSVLIGNRLRVPMRGGGLLGLAVGTAIVVALTSIPFFGGVILVTAWFVALGAGLATRFGSLQPSA